MIRFPVLVLQCKMPITKVNCLLLHYACELHIHKASYNILCIVSNCCEWVELHLSEVLRVSPSPGMGTTI